MSCWVVKYFLLYRFDLCVGICCIRKRKIVALIKEGTMKNEKISKKFVIAMTTAIVVLLLSAVVQLLLCVLIV